MERGPPVGMTSIPGFPQTSHHLTLCKKEIYTGLMKIDGITAFSSKLLHLASVLGVIFFGWSFVPLILLVARKLIGGVRVDGWTTIVCLMVFFGGIILLTIGIIGEYSGKIYTEVKQRPHYIVREAK
jgi:hypothetical protein